MTIQTGSGNVRVLVVDDHRISRRFTVAALRQTGCSVKQARSVRAAVRAALDWLPETILLDWHLGDGDGGEALRAIVKNWPSDRRPPRFVLLTGERAASLPEDLEEYGFDRILAKPCDADELARSVARPTRDTPGVQTVDETELHGLFRQELSQRLPVLDRYISRNRLEGAAEITHQLIAGSILCRDKRLEAAFRRLDSACRNDRRPESVADAWCRLARAAGNFLAEANRAR